MSVMRRKGTSTNGNRTPLRVVEVSQSESERAGAGHHATLCVWYIPEEAAQQPQRDGKRPGGGRKGLHRATGIHHATVEPEYNSPFCVADPFLADVDSEFVGSSDPVACDSGTDADFPDPLGVDPGCYSSPTSGFFPVSPGLPM